MNEATFWDRERSGEFILHLERLPYEVQSALLFSHSWRVNSWIHIIPKGITTMWNANSLVYNFKSGRRVHFQQ